MIQHMHRNGEHIVQYFRRKLDVYFHTVIYYVLTDFWQNCDQYISSVVIPEYIYYILSTRKGFNVNKNQSKNKVCKWSQYMCGFEYVNKEAFNQCKYNE